ncbi:SAF domain-containing protein [Paenibacillus xylaniclasticus]|uniref:SAF domain-containing protein n=1 Tax=Paenibacillus xylaniclasticus TaxID=588083 RepID=UPI000FDA1040|nr:MULTISPECIES: SAF domain-containing protein [Paenibacillus]GFN30930.1 hypothetical protein PCURB6_11900 [Paenibacillus curdlanolyticus]
MRLGIEWNLKNIIILSLAVILFVGTNVGQYYAIWGPKQDRMKAEYEAQVANLQAQLDAIGPMVNIWTIREGATDLYAGKQVEAGDLEVHQIPESLLNRSFVLEPQTVIGKYYKIAMTSGTPLSMDLVMEEPIEDTTREYDIIANVLPIGLRVGDYIDYRIVYPLGEDYIVLSHKRIEAINGKTLKVRLTETEIHMYQAALVDYFLQMQNGAMLYMTKYLEPGIQVPATTYYAVPKNILAIMIADPNILQMANEALNNATRSIIEKGFSDIPQEQGSKLSSGRNNMAGTVENGAVELENELRDKAQAEELVAQMGGESSVGESSPPAETTSSAGASPAASGDSGSLEIGEGVVE